MLDIIRALESNIGELLLHYYRWFSFLLELDLLNLVKVTLIVRNEVVAVQRAGFVPASILDS